MKTIEHEYYNACRKYYFNLNMGREDEKIYFMGKVDALRELFEFEDKKDDELDIIREQAKMDARKDFDYYRH